MVKNLTSEQISKLEAQLSDLYALRATGAKQVSHIDKTVVFKSDAELQRSIDYILKLLGRSTRTRVVKCYTKRDV